MYSHHEHPHAPNHPARDIEDPEPFCEMTGPMPDKPASTPPNPLSTIPKLTQQLLDPTSSPLLRKYSSLSEGPFNP